MISATNITYINEMTMDKSWKNEEVSSPVVHQKSKIFAKKSCL